MKNYSSEEGDLAVAKVGEEEEEASVMVEMVKRVGFGGDNRWCFSLRTPMGAARHGATAPAAQPASLQTRERWGATLTGGGPLTSGSRREGEGVKCRFNFKYRKLRLPSL